MVALNVQCSMFKFQFYISAIITSGSPSKPRSYICFNST